MRFDAKIFKNHPMPVPQWVIDVIRKHDERLNRPKRMDWDKVFPRKPRKH